MAKRASKSASTTTKAKASKSGKGARPLASKAKLTPKAKLAPKAKLTPKAKATKPAVKAKATGKANAASNVKTGKLAAKARPAAKKAAPRSTVKLAGKPTVKPTIKPVAKPVARPASKLAAKLPRPAATKSAGTKQPSTKQPSTKPAAKTPAAPAFSEPAPVSAPREAPVSGPLPSRTPTVPYVPRPYSPGANSPLDADPKRRRQQETAQQFAYEAAQLCRDDKCTDVLLLDVRGLSHISDYIIVGSGTSDRQMKSVLDHVAELGQKYGFTHSKTNSDERSTWLLIDFVDVMVHLFEPTTRAHYDIEMLWGDAPRLEWERPDQLPRDRAGLSLSAGARG